MSFDFVENFTLELPDFAKSDLTFSESFNNKQGLIIEVAAIHEGLTSNYNNYSATELEKALQSWVEPYPKPIILNHDLNNEPIGRVMAARMDKESDGSSYVRLQIAVTDPVAIEKILDKRYLTGSVGGRAGKAVCSITGDDLAEEDANGRPKAIKYKRGKVYKGKLAYIDMQDISFKEYSFVNQPADGKSGIRSIQSPDAGAKISDSDSWVARSSAFVINMESEDIISLNNNDSILKGMKKKESKPLYLHLKGSFLTALAVHESENDINTSKALLSSEDFEKLNSEENSNMENESSKEEDILAVANGLSEDLSTIAATSSVTEEVEEDVEDEDVKDEVESSENSEEQSSEDSSESSNESEVLDVDSEEVEDKEEQLVDSSKEEEAVETQDETVSDELISKNEENEQIVQQLNAKVALLEEENSKLKKALHMTLVERVVDTKIGLGFESVEDREKLISDHSGRTASSLADSLRDLAKAPVVKSKSISIPEISSESEVTDQESNVVTLDKEEFKKESDPMSFEQLLVDTLMGRRKL